MHSHNHSDKQNPTKNHIHAHELLNLWHQRRDQHQWAVGLLIGIDGSSYRKPGAMMLFNELGQHYGLMSGGCLEQHLCRQAVKAINDDYSVILSYDLDTPDLEIADLETDKLNSESQLNAASDSQHWELAIGCGGSVTVFIAPLTEHNNYLSLASVYSAITQNQQCELNLIAKNRQASASIQSDCNSQACAQSPITSTSSYNSQSQQLNISFYPAIKLFICGAGVDAIPLANIADQMGWSVSINETRSQYQKPGRFLTSANTHAMTYNKIIDQANFIAADCIIIMHHNLEIDKQALRAALHSSARYIGVLGPTHRLNTLLELCELQASDFNQRLHGPCGLALGGDNPASVALSIISHCHAVIANASMKSLPL